MKIGITIGDPSGIGPEIIQNIFSEIKNFDASVKWFLYGMPLPNLQNISLHNIAEDLPWKNIQLGIPCVVSAKIQKRAFEEAINDAISGKIDAIVTAPWTKYSFTFLNENPTGHTEILEKALGVKPVMLLAGDRLRVALVTTHIPLAKVSENISSSKIIETSKIVYNSLINDFGIENPSIAILGLNPHAGEKGAMGNEELDIIIPAIQELKKLNINISGPFSADTYFIRYLHKMGKAHDAVICMYHDQGLIPLKTIHFGASANITMGLPIIRTSVDHGTAHDIAGKGIADSSSLKYAMQRAIEIVKNRK